MVFDVLRSTNTLTALVDDKGTVERKIRWLFCKPGAKAFPGWSWAGHPAWEPDPDEWATGPGIRLHPLKYSNNRVRVPPGQEYHGPLEWFENGIPTDEVLNARLRPGEQMCGWADLDVIECRGYPSDAPLSVVTITAYGWPTSVESDPAPPQAITVYGWPSSAEAIVYDREIGKVDAYGWPDSLEIPVIHI